MKALLTLVLALAAAPLCAASADAASVSHVVLCWLKEPGNTAQTERVMRVSRELESIPGIRSMTIGRALPSERDIVDDSFDVGLVMDFASPTAMRDYLTHPEHVSRVDSVFRPLCGRIQVYDIQY